MGKLKIAFYWAASNEKFQESIKLLHSAIYGQLYEGVVRTRFGEALLKQELNLEAREQFTKAVKSYQRLGNMPQAQRVTELGENLG